MLNNSFVPPIHLKSLHDIKNNITLGKTPESIIIDYKREIELISKGSREELAEELATDICQFANTWGGTILIGVEESKSLESGLNIAKKFHNVENSEAIKQFINDKVRQYYYPSYISYEINSINIDESNSLLAINIKPLVEGLACVFTRSRNNYFRFPYRTEYGKKYFKPFEIEERMNNKNRSIFLRLNMIWERQTNVEILSKLVFEPIDKKVQWDNKDRNITIHELGNNEIKLKINDLKINIPYGLIREVWTTIDHKIGLILNANIIVSSNRKELRIEI